MTNPLISIIIPTFNRAYLISQTLHSVINQTYVNWECIIVDDGSTDITGQVIEDFCFKDARFKFYNRPSSRPKGANACRNYGFEVSKGEYINWFDSDDLMHPDFLYEKINVLLQNKDLDFSCCINSTFTSDVSNKTEVERPFTMQSENYLEDYILNGLYFYTHSPLWKKKFLVDKELFDESLHRSQERDFHFRMLHYSPKYEYLDKVLFFKKIDGESITNGSEKSLKAQRSVFKYFHKCFVSIESFKTIENRQKMLEYIFYRQAVNFYNMVCLAKGFSGRLKISMEYLGILFSYSNPLRFSINKIFKITIGSILLLFLKKGYNYFYYPEYDHRRKK